MEAKTIKDLFELVKVDEDLIILIPENSEYVYNAYEIKSKYADDRIMTFKYKDYLVRVIKTSNVTEPKVLKFPQKPISYTIPEYKVTADADGNLVASKKMSWEEAKLKFTPSELSELKKGKTLTITEA